MKLIILSIVVLAAALVHAENLKSDEDKKTEKRGILGTGYSGGFGGYESGGLYSPSAYLTPGGLPRNQGLGLGGLNGYNSGLGYPSTALGYQNPLNNVGIGGLNGLGGLGNGLSGVGGYGSGLGSQLGSQLGYNGLNNGYSGYSGFNNLQPGGAYNSLYSGYNSPLAYNGGLNGLNGVPGVAGGYQPGYLSGYNSPGAGGYSSYSRVIGLQPTGANGGYIY